MKRSLGFICVLASLLSACGGGGGGGGATSSVVPNPGGGAPQASAQAKITIVRPAAATTPGARSAKFIPSSAQSIRVHILSVNGGTPDYNFFPDVIVLLSSLNPACTVLSGGGLSCTVSAKVPVSPGVILQVSAYTSTDGSGTPVAVVTTPPVDTTQPNPVVTASLGGVPTSLTMSNAVLSAPADGTSHTLTFNVNAQDANGNTINPPGTYPTPITLAIAGDTNGALSLSTTSLAAPGVPVTVTYDSTKALTSATITANIAGGTKAISASLQVNPMIYSPAHMNGLFAGGASTAVTVTEANNTSAFTFAGNGANFAVACQPSSCAPAAAGGTVSMMITPQAVGTGTFTISDSNKAVASIPFTVTGQTGGGVTVSNYKIYQYTPPSGNGTPYGIAPGSDGKTLWFTEPANGKIASLDTSTCVLATATCKINELRAANSVWAIAAGNDGNMYVSTVSSLPQPAPSANPIPGGFTQVMSSVSGCASAGSCAQNFIQASNLGDSNSPNSRPSEMTRAVNGTIYALDVAPGANNVISFGANPGGTVYDAFSNNATASFSAIAAGPGAPPFLSAAARRAASRRRMIPNSIYTDIVWTDNATTPSSLVLQMETCVNQCLTTQEFSVPFTSALSGLASGSNGMIYVIEQTANQIAVVDPSTCTTATPFTCNIAAQLKIPTAAADAWGMAPGPDGNIWFTETGTDKIGIININTNTISEISIPGGGAGVDGPKMITMGPDGNMWFTEMNSGKIGEVVL